MEDALACCVPLALVYFLWRFLRRKRASKRRRRRSIPSRVQDYVMMRDQYRCVYCGKAPQGKDLHLDHVIPWSRGGSDNASNLVVACEHCNLSKGDRTPEEWRR